MSDVDTPKIEPVRKSVTVPLPPAEAFDLFTAGMHRWWPLATHSLGGEHAARCAIEPHVGGQVFEEHEDGSRCEWGVVRAWEPPRRFVMSWHPGHPASCAQEVEVRFSASGRGCLVELEHRGWEALGDDAPQVREGYDKGWEGVFRERFAEAAARPA